MSDEILMYGGGSVAIIAIIFILIYYIFHRIEQAKLNKQLDEEYGRIE